MNEATYTKTVNGKSEIITEEQLLKEIDRMTLAPSKRSLLLSTLFNGQPVIKKGVTYKCNAFNRVF